MPSTSKKQHNFMEAVAHSASFAKKAGVPQSVGRDFSKADKGRKFKTGGQIMATKKEARMEPAKMDKGGDLKKGNRKFGEHAVQEKGHTRGKNMGDAGKDIGIQSGAKRGTMAMKRGGMAKKMK